MASGPPILVNGKPSLLSGTTSVVLASGGVVPPVVQTTVSGAGSAAGVAIVSGVSGSSVISGLTMSTLTAPQAPGGTVVATVSVQSTGPALINQAVALTNSAGGDFALNGSQLSLLPNGVPAGTYTLTFRVTADNAPTATFSVSFVVTPTASAASGAGNSGGTSAASGVGAALDSVRGAASGSAAGAGVGAETDAGAGASGGSGTALGSGASTSSGFGQGPNVLLSNGGIFSGPTLAYTSSDTLTLTLNVLQIQPSVTSDLIGNGEWYWYIDTNTKCQGFYSVNGGGVGLTSSFPLPNGGIPRVVVSGASVAFQHSLDGGTTFVAEGTQSLGGAGLTGASAGTLVTGAHLAPIVGWFTVAKNGSVAHSVDFTNAAVGTNTTVADAVSGSWVLSGGAQIVARVPPVVSYTPSNITLNDKTPVGTTIGQFTAVASSGAATSLTLTSNYSGRLAMDGAGIVKLMLPLTGLAGAASSFAATATDGVTASAPKVVSGTIATGLLLDPSTHVTNTFRADLTNGSATIWTNANMTAFAPVVGTVTCSGMTNPSVNLDVANDTVQTRILFGVGINPRYTWSQSGATITVTAQQLSALSDTVAQVDEIVISFLEGLNVCVATIPLTINPIVGPTINVGDGQQYPSVDAACAYAWLNYPAYNGAKVKMHPRANNYADDFGHLNDGHGSQQQYFPGPVTLEGMSSTQKTFVDLNGKAPFGAGSGQPGGKGGIGRAGSDLTVRWLEIAHCSNADAGSANAGAIYCEDQSSGNVFVDDCYLRNSDNGFLNADYGTYVWFRNVKIRMCGDTNRTHNAYVGRCTYFKCENIDTRDNGISHALKVRAMRYDITGGIIGGGLDGRGDCLDMPIGGVGNISGVLFLKPPNLDGGNGHMIQTCEEATQVGIYGNNGPAWNVNLITIDGCTFQSALKPSVGPSGQGADAVSQASPTKSPLDGSEATVIVKNCKFYNVAHSQRLVPFDSYQPYPDVNGLGGYARPTDGGGNTDLTTWTDVPNFVDSSGNALNPPDAVWNNDTVAGSLQCVMVTAGQNQCRIPVNAAVGTTVVNVFGSDGKCARVASPIYSLLDNASGRYSITSVGDIKVAAALSDTLDYVNVQISGSDKFGNAVSMTGWVAIPVGTGYVAASP